METNRKLLYHINLYLKFNLNIEISNLLNTFAFPLFLYIQKYVLKHA